MKIGNRYLARSVALLVLAAISSCSKLSHVGDQTEPAPQAIAVTIGEAYTTDSSGNLQASVRAGSEVVLSGKESEKGDNDTGVPLINFTWQQLAAGNNAVQLIQRTSNTVSFTAPQVTAATTLNFRLTVSDVKGNTSSTEAHITVQPIRDQDHFLQYLNVSTSIPVVLATQTAIAADSTASATATLPVTLTITKLVTFPDRNDSSITHTRVPVGTPITITTGWNSKLGSSTSCTGNENPTVQVPVPRLNLDDLLPVGTFPDAVVLSDVLEPADIDHATLEVRIDVASANSTVTTSTPVACVNGVASASASIFATEALLASAAPRDSKAAAQAYYNTTDPTSSKDTLNKWLDANGFTSGVSGWNADAHAVYTNNFDLGFGRDMYMKIGGATGKCDDGTTALPVTQAHINSGLCDVAAVVVNYSGVEAAAKKLNPVVAVAMEYSAPPSGGARIVKFYTFTPDTRTGDYTRVLSVNLDRRGEQYMPQACVVCHGGTPGVVDGSGKYNGNGDVKAGFLPWDLDSLLYSDTDPGFSTKTRNAALRAQYTRAMQEAQFKTLNSGAYLTSADPSGATGRYAVVRELLEGWYHGSSTTGLTATTFDGSFVPQGWKPAGIDAVPGTADDNPVDSATIYTDVFARDCRMCHSLQVPVAGDPRTATVTVNGAGALSACTNDTRLANSRVGTQFQVPMGCYWEFAHAPNLADRLSRNQMPFARRTSDRTWVNGANTQTAGATLQAHLLSTQNLTVATPGTVSACVDSFGSAVQDQGVTKYQVTRGAWLNVGSTCSRFLTTPHWTLTAPNGSGAVLIGADTAAPRFLPDMQGDYTLTLSDGASASVSVIAQVAVVSPTAVDGAVSVALGAGGTGSGTVDVSTLAGFSPPRDAVASIQVVSVSTGLTATPSGTSTLNITANSLAGGTVSYQLVDIDGDASNTAVITVGVSATLSIASTPTLPVTANSTGVAISLGSYVNNPSAQALVFTIVTQPNLSRTLSFDDNWNDLTNRQNQTAAVGHATLTNSTVGTISYNAPPHVLTHFGSTTVGALDSFTYKACFAAQTTTCTATGTVFINLTSASNQSFYGVSQGLASNCASCHLGAPTGANLAIPATFNGTTYVPPASGSVGSKTFYCALRGLSTTGGFDAGTSGNEADKTPYFNLSSPVGSLLYLKPQAAGGCATPTYPTNTATLCHGGGNVLVAPNATLTAIYNWVNEGAYFTEGTSTNQDCP